LPPICYWPFLIQNLELDDIMVSGQASGSEDLFDHPLLLARFIHEVWTGPDEILWPACI
jgi:hypothetical protein